MKAIFKFNLPEDQDEYDVFIKANDMHQIIWEMKQWLRSHTKYAPDDISDDTINALYKCRDKFNELINDNNLEI
jgi:FPC/CPF motif-containing protein YcgG